jgi:phosphatidylglycerophosphatase A
MALFALAGSVVCVACASAAIEATKNPDPPEVVADEFAGQALTLLIAAGAAQGHCGAAALAAFIVFRLFDVLKPWPARSLEALPEGWGVLADDLAAGLYAGIACRLLLPALISAGA